MVKSIILPGMVHIFLITTQTSLSFFFKSLEQLLFKSMDTVSINLLVEHYGDGGFTMINLCSFGSSLYVKWIRFGHASWIGLFPNLFTSRVPASDRMFLYGPVYLKTPIRSSNIFSGRMSCQHCIVYAPCNRINSGTLWT